MALFTLDRAYVSGNTLKYEQLNSDETHSASNTLPTDSANQSSISEARRGLEGTAAQASAFTPLKPGFNIGGADGHGANATTTPQLPGAFGLQASSQNLSPIGHALANPGSGASADATSAHAQDAADSHALAGGNSQTVGLLATNTIIDHTPADPSNPGGGGNPTNPGGGDNGGNPSTTPHDPTITVSVGGGTEPLVHLDANLPTDLGHTVVTPTVNLVTDTLHDVLTQGPSALPDVVNHAVDTLSSVTSDLLHNTGLTLTVQDLAQNPSVPPLINLDLGHTAPNDVASLVDGSLLQNPPAIANIVHGLTDPASLLTTLTSNVLAEITIGGDSSPNTEGSLADLNLLHNIPIIGDTTLVDISAGAGDTGHATIADVSLLSGTPDATTPSLDLSLGGDSSNHGALADLNLLGGIPVLSDTTLVDVSAGGTDTSNASLLDLHLNTTPDTATQLLDLGLGSGDTASSGLINVNLLSSIDLPGTDLLGQVLDTVTNPASTTNTVPDILSGATDALQNTLTGIDNALVNTTPTDANAVTDLLAGLVGGVEDTTHSVTDSSSNLLANLTSGLGDVVSNAVSGTQSTTSSVIDTLTNTGSGNPIQNTVSNVTDTVSNVTNTVTNTTTAAVNTVVSTITTILPPVVSNPVHSLLHGLHL